MNRPSASDPGFALVRLLQLASPTLPIGNYSYSQGLEWAIGNGTVQDAPTAQRWVGDLLDYIMPSGEAAVAWRMLEAARASDWPACARWNSWFRASRETAELAAETEQTGHSLLRLAGDLELLDAAALGAGPALLPVTLPAAFALASRGLGLATDAALTAYLWAWLENQILCAVKSIPLGQVAGQRMLLALGERIPAVVATARATGDDEITSFAPGLAIASSLHETQYTRLFRS
jgi:urease accessory protein